MSPMRVWYKVTRESAQNDPEGKIVGTRWVIVQKGDKVRCRLVAQSFSGNDKREDLYAGTPPASATRYLLSDIVSNDRRRRSPHNCTTEETTRNSHRADSSCTLYPREKIGNTDQMKETFVILIRLVRLRERWEDLGLKGVGGL